jgi:hypothetical protein
MTIATAMILGNNVIRKLDALTGVQFSSIKEYRFAHPFWTGGITQDDPERTMRRS